MRFQGKTTVALACVAQLALLGVAMGDRLSARLTGEEYLLEVAPVDPIDPFRGAYVALRYPGIDALDADETRGDESRGEDLFVPLVRSGSVWEGQQLTADRPDSGPYLTCTDGGWRVRCGIESYFLPQDEAVDLERAVADGDAVARLRIDGRGHAVVMGVETSG